MNPLQEPIREVLQDGVSEEAVQRVWKGVRRRRSARAGVERRYAFAFAAATLLAVISLVFALRSPARDGVAGPLLEANGHALNTLGAVAASTTRLSDGSRIELDAGAELEVLDNDASSFVCVLRHGRGTFDVKPGGPRRWRIEAGALRVEVVGTRFAVDRRESRVSVEVEHGVVLVRGDRVPDGVQKLTAGSRLSLELSEERKAKPESAPTPAAPSSAEAPVVQASASTVAAAQQATHVAAPQADLLQLADEQRRRGNLKAAIATLRTAARSDDSRRAIAAFTLGKLLLDAAGRPGEAAEAFRSCLRMSPPAAVAEDASARLVEAQARAGSVEAAQRSARDYERRYPSGRRLADVRRWAGEN